MTITICDLCGGDIRIGDYPFCKGVASAHMPANPLVIGDDIPGGVEIKHGICWPDGTPRKYYTKSEMARVAKENNLENLVRHTPPQGSDKSKQTQRWV